MKIKKWSTETKYLKGQVKLWNKSSISHSPIYLFFLPNPLSQQPIQTGIATENIAKKIGEKKIYWSK